MAVDIDTVLAIYERGDYATALPLFRALAENGHPFAQFCLGFMYRKGEGVPQSDVEAIKWYGPAAERGLAAAQTNLGFMYQYGLGIGRDLNQAAQWFQRAAAQGDNDARFNLAVLEKSRSLLPMLAKLSAGDRSVLEGSIANPGSKMMTIAESQNDIVWSEMERVGWARQPTNPDLPQIPNHSPKVFEVTDEGRRAVPRLLLMIKGRTGN